MTLKKIKVYGKLRKFLGESSFEADVNTPSQAIKFLLCNFPEVESHMANQHYKIKMGEQDIPLDLLHLKGEEDIKIIPVASGSLPAVGAVFGAISSGAAVVASAASAIPVVGGIASAAIGAVGTVAGVVGTVATAIPSIPVIGGIASAVATSVAIDGVTSLITPTPSVPTSSAADSFSQNDPQMQASNFAFSGIQNVSRSGVALPIIYGERFVGSIIVSNGVDTVQVDGTA
jgi:predicted phage tail protein